VTDFTEPKFDHPPRPMAQRVGAIVWPSFFAAGVATMAFFAFVEQVQFDSLAHHPNSFMRITCDITCAGITCAGWAG
jgi:hypothetical protein